ncbi:site-specific integrase [Nocardia sp. BMG111209]|uniref:tyrosine-type recombinase/integrase n=1 Tax=Nocardia sp. BMG111209 TaxID=1160137 RepID=UPI0018CAE68C|nr:site-specific integrase [Nocardia sp. BMG111209]
MYGKTRQEVQIKLVVHSADAARGILIPDRSWTLSAYIDYWMSEIAPTRLRSSSLLLYAEIIRVHIKPMIGSQLLTTLSVARLQHMMNRQLTLGKSISTIWHIRVVLSAVLTRAMREELVMRNVARLVELPSVTARVITPWSLEEAARFLTASQTHKYSIVYVLLLVYGMRRGEVLGLRWSDIDWERNQIHVRQQLIEVKTQLMTGPVKTKAGNRTLPLLPAIRDLLSRHQAATEFIAPKHSLGDLIFLTSGGLPIRPGTLTVNFNRLCDRAGLRRIRLHDLRHTAATFLKNAGVPARDTQLILGHASVLTTQEIYQHGDSEAQYQALDRVGRQLLYVGDSSRSRLSDPSDDDFSDPNMPSASGDSGNISDDHRKFVKLVTLSGDSDLTPVFLQLRRRTSLYMCGAVAVKFTVKMAQQTHDTIVLQQWIPLREALLPHRRLIPDFTQIPATAHLQTEESRGT